jgi:hypothetical protein
MLVNIAWFSVGMALTAMTTSIFAFGAGRFFTGIGVGALVATVGALVAEFAPADKRNRYNAIVQEASMLRVEGNANSGQFQSIKSRLTGMSPAYTAEQIAKGQAKSGGRTVGTSGRRVVSVEPPSTSYWTHQPSNFLRISVPANWDEVDTGDDGVTYAPEGGCVQGDNGGTAFTHGVQVGVVPGGSGNLQRDTQQLLQTFSQSNPELRAAGSARRETIGGRQGITTPLSNVST